MRHIFRRTNIGIFLYLLLNLSVLELLVSPFLVGTFGFGAYVLLALGYFTLAGVAVSPVGETILRWSCGARRFRRMDWNARYGQPFRQTLQAARTVDRTIPPDIQLYYVNDPVPNAFAAGWRSIYLTTGLMDCPDEEIRAVIAHELGHISNRDTQVIQLVTVGNVFAGTLIAVIQVLRIIMSAICFVFSFCLSGRIALILTQVVTWIPIQILRGILAVSMFFVNLTRRSSEYDADAFAVRLGYGPALVTALENTGRYPTGRQTVWQLLNRTHPDTDERIARIQHRDLAAHSEHRDSAVSRVTSMYGGTMAATTQATSPVTLSRRPEYRQETCRIRIYGPSENQAGFHSYKNGRIILH